MYPGRSPHRVVALTLAVTAACGRFGFDAGGGSPDPVDAAPGDGGDAPDQLGPAATGCAYAPTLGAVLHVATTGDDATGDGSAAAPLRTIPAAITLAGPGATILVAPGSYPEVIVLTAQHDPSVTLRSEVPYRAQLTAPTTTVGCFQCAGWTIEGFDFTRDGLATGGAEPLVHLLESPGAVILRNNILRDSADETLVRINQTTGTIFARNLLYNAGAMGLHVPNAIDAIIEDNLFFAATTPAPSVVPLIWVEMFSAAAANVVRRNLLRGWEGARPWAMLFVSGIDGFVVENNLLVLDGPGDQIAPMWFSGASLGTIRHNTVVGHADASNAAAHLSTDAGPTADLAFTANLWSDPSGTMAPIFGGPTLDVTGTTLAGNGYWNGGQPVPDDPGAVVTLASDATAVVGDPELPVPTSLPLPTWDPVAGVFADGSTTICEAFARQALALGMPSATGAAAGAAAPSDLDHDLRGWPRPTAPALGAIEPR